MTPEELAIIVRDAVSNHIQLRRCDMGGSLGATAKGDSDGVEADGDTVSVSVSGEDFFITITKT